MGYIIVSFFSIVIGIGINLYINKVRNIKSLRLTNLLIRAYKNKIDILSTVVLIVSMNLLLFEFDSGYMTLLYSGLLIILLIISQIDLKAKIIPNTLIILTFILGMIIVIINKELTLYSSILGFFIAGGLLMGVSIITKGALGLGDVKLFAVLGFVLGLNSILSILLITTFLSGIVSIILLTFGLVNRKTTLPLAPFTYIATLLLILTV